MTPTEVCNLSLAEIGNRTRIASFSDNSPAAQAAQTFYLPKTQMLLRSARWDFARAQITLTQWKAAAINGVASSNPPPQPWLYSYLWPSDCLAARFILPTLPIVAGGTPLTSASNLQLAIPPAPTAIPFVVATDLDTNGNPIKVILTNLINAQLIYTRDLSQYPDQWDSLFLAGETALLASYFINALARNKAQYDDQVAVCKNVIDQARTINGNEQIANVDHTPDWLSARQIGGAGWGWNSGGPGSAIWLSGVNACVFADGQFY